MTVHAHLVVQLAKFSIKDYLDHLRLTSLLVEALALGIRWHIAVQAERWLRVQAISHTVKSDLI